MLVSCSSLAINLRLRVAMPWPLFYGLNFQCVFTDRAAPPKAISAWARFFLAVGQLPFQKLPTLLCLVTARRLVNDDSSLDIRIRHRGG